VTTSELSGAATLDVGPLCPHANLQREALDVTSHNFLWIAPLRTASIYTPQKKKLAVGPRAAPVRLVPHTGQTGFRKTSRWDSGTGQTGASDRSGSRHPQNFFLRN
jgi:hypothetical protein